MNLSVRAHEERDLPKIWDGGFNPDRLDWYTRLVLDHGGIRGGRDVVAEFIAAMMLESGLDNLTVGNNARNGSDNPYLGIGWCQLDTGYHATSVVDVHAIRFDPQWSLDYIATNDDLCYQGPSRTWLNKQRWHAWEPERLDPPEGEWSPIEATLAAYDRVA